MKGTRSRSVSFSLMSRSRWMCGAKRITVGPALLRQTFFHSRVKTSIIQFLPIGHSGKNRTVDMQIYGYYYCWIGLHMERTINDSPSVLDIIYIFPQLLFFLFGFRVHHLASRAHLTKSKLECACWHSNETRHPPIVSASFLSFFPRHIAPDSVKNQSWREYISMIEIVTVLPYQLGRQSQLIIYKSCHIPIHQILSAWWPLGWPEVTNIKSKEKSFK